MARAIRNLTTSELCDELSISQTTLKRYIREGMPHTKSGPGRGNLFDPAECAAWMQSNSLTGEPGRPRSEASKDRESEELRKITAMADNWEIRNARELAELLPVAEVKARWARVAHEVRGKILNVAATVAPAIMGMSPREATEEIDRHLREALETIDPDAEPTTSAAPG